MTRANKWETTLIWPDTHYPDQHKKAVDTVLEFVAVEQPDRIVLLGDLADCKAPARWSKGTIAEFAGGLAKEQAEVKRLFRDIRDIYDGPIDFIEGNHEARIGHYIMKYAPAFSDLEELSVPNLFGFDTYEIRQAPRFLDVAPGWVATHGDAGGLLRTAGGTALSLARRIGKSVVCGHTHRQGIQQETSGLNGKLNTLTGFEAGHLMDIRKADYLKTGAASWQMGFGLLHSKGTNVVPQMIPILKDGTAYVSPTHYGI